jgi:hypothetical protein
MSKCVDPKVGVLIHGYELHSLTEEETELFETHLMQCTHCFQEVSELEVGFGKLRANGELGVMAERSLAETPADRAWRRLLWPKVPLAFRPAFIYFLVLVLAVPVVFTAIRSGSGGVVRPLQTIRLLPTRTLEVQTLIISSGLDGVITFAAPVYESEGSYHVVIADKDDGRIIKQDDDFRQVDDTGIGRILFPNSSMTPGDYSLNVWGVSEAKRLTYYFRISE